MHAYPTSVRSQMPSLCSFLAAFNCVAAQFRLACCTETEREVTLSCEEICMVEKQHQRQDRREFHGKVTSQSRHSGLLRGSSSHNVTAEQISNSYIKEQKLILTIAQ